LSGSFQGSSVGLFPWLNQSRIMNWSQAAASTLSVVAGAKVWRVISSRLTRRGFGSRIEGSGSG
jgi:hypothetical protein